MDGHFTNDPMLGFKPEPPGLGGQRFQRQQRQPQQQQPGGGGENSKHYTETKRRGRPSLEDRAEREARYKLIGILTRDLSFAVEDEMTRRKDLWELEGNREEEILWESRKQEIYEGLKGLAGQIQRAFRDRQKEAVMEMWDKEREKERASLSASGTGPGRGGRVGRSD